VRVSAKRLLDAASYGLRLSPPTRRKPVSHLRLAAERYKAAASSQHLDAVLANYRQKWIIEPETLDADEKYRLVLYAKVAVNEIVLHHPDREDEFSQLTALIEDLEIDLSEDKWGTFRHELLRVLPDLDNPIAREFEADPAGESDQFRFIVWDDHFVFGHKEKGAKE
jgi:hypothetical protein